MLNRTFEDDYDTEEFLNERTLKFQVRKREFKGLLLSVNRIKEIVDELKEIERAGLEAQAEGREPESNPITDFVFERTLSEADNKALQKMINDNRNPLLGDTVDQLWRMLALEILGLNFPDPKSEGSSDGSDSNQPIPTTD